MFNTSLNNALTRANKSEVANWALPSGSILVTVTPQAVGTEWFYYAEADGFIQVSYNVPAYRFFWCYNQTAGIGVHMYCGAYSGTYANKFFVPCRKGDKIAFNIESGGAYNSILLIGNGGNL